MLPSGAGVHKKNAKEYGVSLKRSQKGEREKRAGFGQKGRVGGAIDRVRPM